MEKKIFTKKEEQKIIALYKEFLSAKKIADIFFCSQKVIFRILKENHIKTGNKLNIKKEELNIMRKLYLDEHKSSYEIANIFGYHSSSITRALKREGVNIRNNSEARMGVKNKHPYTQEQRVARSQRVKEEYEKYPNLRKLRGEQMHKSRQEGKIKSWNKGLKGVMPEAWNKGLTKETDERVNKYSTSLIGRKRLDLTKRNLEYNFIQNSKIEIKIQNFLTALHLEFFIHKYISEISHAYQCDILIPEQETEGVIIAQKTIIECDGCYWHGCPICKRVNNRKDICEQKKRDKLRTEELIQKGFKVVRIWEHEIKNMKLNELKEKII